MLFALYERAYRLVNRFSSLDITQVLVLQTDSLKRPAPNTDYEFQTLSADEVRFFSGTANSELRPELAELVESNKASCYAALRQAQLAGYLWLARGEVAAEFNSGGKQFNGIGLSLPAPMRYLFKAYVLPEQRGNALNARILAHACTELSGQQVSHIITTTEWNNHAFLNSAKKSGFEAVGLASEWVLGNKHLFHYPRRSLSGAHLKHS